MRLCGFLQFAICSSELSSTELSNGFANHEQTLNSTKTWRLQCEHDELAQHLRNIAFWLFSCWNGAGRCWSRDAHTAAQVSSLTDDSYTESVRWAANKRLEISNFNFKFRRARNYEVIGLVLGCIEATFCKEILVVKLSPRSTQCTPLHRSLISIFSWKIAEILADFLI